MPRIAISHSIRLIRQPNPNDCWATAIAMVRRCTVASVQESARQAGVRLERDGGLVARDVANTQRLAMAVNLRCHNVQQRFPSLQDMAGYMRPVAAVILGGFNYSGSRQAMNHAVAAHRLMGDGTERGTQVTVIDPLSGRTFVDDWEHFVADDGPMADPHFILSGA